MDHKELYKALMRAKTLDEANEILADASTYDVYAMCRLGQDHLPDDYWQAAAQAGREVTPPRGIPGNTSSTNGKGC